jgi:pimeloyl-ACP methyl ester carboxylesterase
MIHVAMHHRILIAVWLGALGGGACSSGPSLAVAQRGILREEAVSFRSGPYTLAGTMVLPAGLTRSPAIVLFHGSGPQHRDLMMARWFAEQGLVALAYDKRGVGESTGDFRTVPFTDLCDDGLAAIALLKRRADVDAARIGVWGLSQGGWLGPLAASRSKDARFVIAVSGPGVSPGEQMIYYYANDLRHQGLSESEIEEASTLRRLVWRFLSTNEGYEETKTALDRAASRPWFAMLKRQADGGFDRNILRDETLRMRPWFRSEVNYDPRIALQKLSVPALFVFGERDELVPVPASVAIVQATLAGTGHHDFLIKVFPGADHTIRVEQPGGSSGLAAGYLDLMSAWLRRTLPALR